MKTWESGPIKVRVSEDIDDDYMWTVTVVLDEKPPIDPDNAPVLYVDANPLFVCKMVWEPGEKEAIATAKNTMLEVLERIHTASQVLVGVLDAELGQNVTTGGYDESLA